MAIRTAFVKLDPSMTLRLVNFWSSCPMLSVPLVGLQTCCATGMMSF